MLKKINGILLLLLLLTILTGCQKRNKDGESAISPTPVLIPSITITEPVKETPQVTDITLLTDPSYETFFEANPYSQLSKYISEVYNIDKSFYNALYEAVKEKKTSLNISHFELSKEQIRNTCEALYEQAGLGLFYLHRVKWSKDYKTVNFSYIGQLDNSKEKQDHFYADMNHLLYNVAPENYDPYQKFFAVYDYICKTADYTDDLNDPFTFTPFSILVNHKGICGGFAFLADYVLNFLGIKTEYISNEPHAWNIVELGGSRYHTDFTWGAGSAGSNSNLLYTALMDDEARMEGLNLMDFGGYEIISGYNRDNPKHPDPCTDNRYNLFNNIYQNYTLDFENSYIYYSESDRINRIKMDGTGLETVLNSPAYYLTYYKGKLYYAGENPKELYELLPGGTPKLLDDSIEIYKILLKDGILTYGNDFTPGNIKTLNLNTFSKTNYKEEQGKHFPGSTINKTHTFQIQIGFKQSMDTSILPRDQIFLTNKEGRLLPLNLRWSDNGQELYIRCFRPLYEEPEVTLYLMPGIKGTDGQLTKDYYDFKITLQ